MPVANSRCLPVAHFITEVSLLHLQSLQSIQQVPLCKTDSQLSLQAGNNKTHGSHADRSLAEHDTQARVRVIGFKVKTPSIQLSNLDERQLTLLRA